ncbi:MAG: hypothetical protein N2506_00505, partial [Dehalococcoidales bacterium]|nr:hypothetical protein [Dehalococcoidales bacterium]
MSELPRLIQAMLEPSIYPEPPAEVRLIQTQISCVFLAGSYAYKVKKPVDMGFLDYTTLAKRRHCCEKEVELNRRLCPETYLGVVTIRRDGERFTIGGTGEVAEYAVWMRRLPEERMMDRLLAENRVTPEMVAAVARRIAIFHGQAETSEEIARTGGIAAVIKNTEENFTQTEKYFGITITPSAYRRIRTYTEEFIRKNERLFLRRMAEGRVRDCHGDLHAAHVCFLGDTICIYDCIEFIDRLRYTDVAAEIAFLAMDLDYHGRSDLARAFVQTYVRESG